MKLDQSDRDLLARWASPSSDGMREEALLARLPDERQALVLQRLRVLGPFIEAQEKGEGRPVDAAISLKLTTRSLYRLAKRVQEMGAVSALAPTPGAGRKRRSDADKSLSKEVESALFQEVFRYPHQPSGVLVSKMREVDSDVSASTVRRRAMTIRKTLEVREAARFGRVWLLDQAALRIPVATAEGDRWMVCAFLVDVDTGIICGRAPVTGQNDPGFGALLHALSRMGALLGTRLTFLSAVDEVIWAAPDGWLGRGQTVSDQAAELRPPVTATVLMSGKFRRGSKLSAVLGGDVAGTEIMIRATADPRIGTSVEGMSPMDEASALAYVDRDIIYANLPMAQWMKRLDAPKTPSRARIASLMRIMNQLVDVFEPALSPDELTEARRLVAAIDPDCGRAG
ncbi:hypothetical protein O6027_07325 [Sphingomonas aerolata]|uniref:hypothetical protein n=1 Tax=Sphingomonas aerolata TaxID=185951 RepID=UPI00334A76E3